MSRGSPKRRWRATLSTGSMSDDATKAWSGRRYNRLDCARPVRFSVVAGDIDHRQTYPLSARRPQSSMPDSPFKLMSTIRQNASSKSP